MLQLKIETLNQRKYLCYSFLVIDKLSIQV